MEVLRRIIDSDSLESVISLPREFKHKKVEILILPVDEKKEEFNPEEFKGSLNIKKEELEEELQHIRNEWERL